MHEETYNGWKNYETWCVALWLNNDESTQELAQEYAKAGADYLKQWVESLKNDHDDTAGMFSDLLGKALDRVDWQAVAEGLLEE